MGYLAKDLALLYKPFVDRVTATGHFPTATARICAVVRPAWEDSKPRFHSNIRLALAEPHSLIPLNEPPDEQYSIIPWGGELQVLGEHEHFDVLSPYVTDAGRGLLLVTLHRGVPEKPRAADFIEVRVDGRRAGQMSGVTSKHFLPVVDHLQSRGLTTAAWAQLKGSGLAAELVLQGTKASEIDSGWLGGEPVTIPRLVSRADSYTVPNAYGRETSVSRSRIKTTLGQRISRALR